MKRSRSASREYGSDRLPVQGRLKRPLKPLPTVGWRSGCLALIDQTLLPGEYKVLRLDRIEDVHEAIVSLRVRGAPAIGVAAAYGLCVGLKEASARLKGAGDFLKEAARVGEYLISARPTAVNLPWAVRRLLAEAERDAAAGANPARLWRRILAGARAIHEEEIGRCAAIACHGAPLFAKPGINILTHCNTGSLATVGIGTALGPILAAAADHDVHVWIDETRPLLQGARLNTWELMRYGVRATLICDNMAAMLMAQGRVDAVILGADRIAPNGDFANKIGTYSLAVNCRHHGIPFYCAAPLSTFDWSLKSGADIPIEERRGDEVRGFRDVRWAPAGVDVYNPSFDVTPGRLVTAIITERGIARAPFRKSLAAWRG